MLILQPATMVLFLLPTQASGHLILNLIPEIFKKKLKWRLTLPVKVLKILLGKKNTKDLFFKRKMKVA